MAEFRYGRAFVAVPFAAAATWYGLQMLRLLVVNGRLRFMTDIVAFGYGTVILGIPVAAVITVGLALPAFWMVKILSRISLLSTSAAGVVIGSLASLAAYLLGDPSMMPAWVGPIVGLTASLCWWILAGKPGRFG